MNNVKKVLIVSNMYPSKKYPHYGVFVKNMADAITESNINIEKIVCYKYDTFSKKILSYFLFYIKIVTKLLINKYEFIYVHYAAHCAPPILFAKKIKRRIKVVTNVHGNDIVPENEKDKKMCNLSKKLIEESIYVISPSKYFSDILKEHYDCDSKKIIIIPSGGVNLDVFYPKSNNSNFDNKIVIGFVSRIEKNKGWDIFLEMVYHLIKINSSIHFIVVGTGSEDNLFKMKMEELNLVNHIEWFPFFNQYDLAELYRKMDIFCFPTRRESESLGLVGLEAMACGCILVGSNKFGPSSYIENGVNAFSFNPFSCEELLNTVVKVLNLSSLEKESIISNSIKTAKAYSSKIANKKLVDFIKKEGLIDE